MYNIMQGCLTTCKLMEEKSQLTTTEHHCLWTLDKSKFF